MLLVAGYKDISVLTDAGRNADSDYEYLHGLVRRERPQMQKTLNLAKGIFTAWTKPVQPKRKAKPAPKAKQVPKQPTPVAPSPASAGDHQEDATQAAAA